MSDHRVLSFPLPRQDGQLRTYPSKSQNGFSPHNQMHRHQHSDSLTKSHAFGSALARPHEAASFALAAGPSYPSSYSNLRHLSEIEYGRTRRYLEDARTERAQVESFASRPATTSLRTPFAQKPSELDHAASSCNGSTTSVSEVPSFLSPSMVERQFRQHGRRLLPRPHPKDIFGKEVPFASLLGHQYVHADE
eukprot:4980718-Pleurochrysis_carterae.AAC.3